MEVEVDFIEFDSWEDFDRIANILSKDLKFKLIQKTEGIDARVYEFSDKNFQFWLVHDDIAGNFLKSESSESLRMLKEITKKVENILKSA